MVERELGRPSGAAWQWRIGRHHTAIRGIRRHAGSIDHASTMRRLIPMPQPLPLILLANGGVALLTSGATLVLLLIAPLGLAGVITCTMLVALLSFGAGVLKDLLFWRWLGLAGGISNVAGSRRAERFLDNRSQSLAGHQPERLPERSDR